MVYTNSLSLSGFLIRGQTQTLVLFLYIGNCQSLHQAIIRTLWGFKGLQIELIDKVSFPFAHFEATKWKQLPQWFYKTCGLYYKTITIVIMTIVSDAQNCGVITYDRNWQHWLRLGSSIMIVSSFIIQANVITIINYDSKTFIVQATGYFDQWNTNRR